MRLTATLQDWFNYRPGEGRVLGISLLGAFFVLAALTLARALREALYLGNFPVETLPYITATVALLSLPAVTGFTRLIHLMTPRKVVSGVVLVQMLGLVTLWLLNLMEAWERYLIVIFYVWTSLGILIIASGFWVVTSDLFPVRGAKRLFGLISAGGTAGALVMGISIRWLSGLFSPFNMIPLLIVLLMMFLLVQRLLPERDLSDAPIISAPDRIKNRERWQTIWRSRHLRTITLIVFAGTMASALVDYQFKDALRNSCLGSPQPEVEMANFLGGFYGWTGGVALLFQLLVASRIITSAGIGVALAILPLAILAGSAGLILLPGLLTATLLRGADNSLRKSVFRPAIEILFVPLPINLKRGTKTFIDTVVDTLAEGGGAVVIFILITQLKYQASILTMPVVLLIGVFLLLSRRMDRQYLRTIVGRLKEGGPDTDAEIDHIHFRGGIQYATFTRLDLSSLRFQDSVALGVDRDAMAIKGSCRLPEAPPGSAAEPVPVTDADQGQTELEMLLSPKAVLTSQAIESIENWDQPKLAALIQILARDKIYPVASVKLEEIMELAEARLVEILTDQGEDFVIRRRIPRMFATSGGAAADDALLHSLTCRRFEIRYRSALALSKRQKGGLPISGKNRDGRIWRAVRDEVKRGRPVWELQKLLDGADDGDQLSGYVGERGALSLEHTFRVLSLILEEEPIRAAFQGIMVREGSLNDLALEYLEQVLPRDIKERLWQFIGDISEKKRAEKARPLGAVVSDLMATQMTMFAGEQERAALRKILGEQDETDHRS